jgi:5'-3' exoribonuclease 2
MPFFNRSVVVRVLILLDGVAPRAKMNQQRSRRFRSVQEAKEDAEAKAELWKLLISSGQAEPGSSPPAQEKFDSNVITPGTPFMDKLALALRYWAAYKVNTEPAWANLKIVISDASVPGEGEHKIIEFIRSQRRSPEHDPNTRHVIYGLDADLIMLGLITHEPHFRILREDVFYQDSKPRRCRLCNQTGHMADECTGETKVKEGEFDEKESPPEKKPYIWLHVAALREYLEIELHHSNNVGFKWDLERAIDDYVFLCFFVGNDFLPHLPTLSIREEGIDLLVQVWKESLALMGGYVTKDGTVDLKKAQFIFDGIAKREDKIFKDRREVDLRREASAKRRKLEREARSGPNTPASGQRGRGGRRQKHEENADDVITFKPGEANSREVREMGQEIYLQRKEIYQAQVDNANTANKSAAAVLKEQLLRRKSADAKPEEDKPNADEEAVLSTPSALGKRKADEMDDGDDTPGRTTPVPKGDGRPTDEMPPDDVRLWEDGYADRYYERKFHVDPKDIEFRHKVAAAYVEGLCWVALYYIQGCPSWTWFYPYHYAPFAQDFVKASRLELHFEKGQTFRPYEQLMGVLPAASNHAIPKPFRSLMEEPDSPIIDFYPEDFELDLNGKKFRWQGVALLPFIDEKRLLDAMATKYPELTEDEVSRNQVGKDVLVISKKHPSYADILTSFYSKKQGEPRFKLNPKKSGGMSGQVEKIEDYLPEGPLVCPLEVDMPDFPEDQSMRCVHCERRDLY